VAAAHCPRLDPHCHHYCLSTGGAGVAAHQPDDGAQQLPPKAQGVVVGGGVIGASVAYHLTKLGWKDVVVLEQNTMTSGTTWHAAGLVGMLRGTETETKLSMYGRELYSCLEEETGLATGFKQCGSLNVARTPERLELFKRNQARGMAFGVEAELVTPEECGAIMAGPEGQELIRTGDLVGGLRLPLDGSADPTMCTNSLAKGARMNGAQIFEGVRVTGFGTAGGRVTGVHTADGQSVATKYVVNCAGQWARQLGAKAGVSVPLHSAEHYYVVTDTVEAISPDTPVMRDPDGCRLASAS
jgi:glycine/D-amino acid oxidase-like deaminating enzyme